MLVADLKESPGAEGWALPGMTTTRAIHHLGGRAVFHAADIADERAVDDAIKAAHGAFGRFDIMLNAAGAVRAGELLHTYSAEDLDFCYRVNLRGAWNCTMAAIQQFLAKGEGGCVVNIVSTAGVNAFRREGPYAMTKAAAAKLVRNAASEYAAKGICVNGICPTFTRTPMTAGISEVPGFDDFIRE